MQAFKNFNMNLAKFKIFSQTTVLVLIVTLTLTSCKTSRQAVNQNIHQTPRATLTYSKLNKKVTSISRLTEYTFEHTDIPQAFDNVTILFISDLHYPSLFKREDIYKLGRYIASLDYDILCLGGDYHEDTNLINKLFDELGKHVPEMGAYAVLGNNDYERGYKEIVKALENNKIKLLEHEVIEIKSRGERIYIGGIRDPFNLKANGISPTLKLKDKDFVILLTHTPDYTEDVSIKNTDLALAGHTHGGQVRIMGVAPIIPSKYKERFLTGLRYNSEDIPIIITNGIGTSNKNIRIGAPSEIVLIHLKRTN